MRIILEDFYRSNIDCVVTEMGWRTPFARDKVKDGWSVKWTSAPWEEWKKQNYPNETKSTLTPEQKADFENFILEKTGLACKLVPSRGQSGSVDKYYSKLFIPAEPDMSKQDPGYAYRPRIRYITSMSEIENKLESGESLFISYRPEFAYISGCDDRITLSTALKFIRKNSDRISRKKVDEYSFEISLN